MSDQGYTDYFARWNSGHSFDFRVYDGEDPVQRAYETMARWRVRAPSPEHLTTIIAGLKASGGRMKVWKWKRLRPDR